MSSARHRMCLTAAVAAVVALAPISSAKGGPEKSPFAGTYAWNRGTYQVETWAVTISDGGQITGSIVVGYSYTKGSLSGRVRADGSYSFTMSVTRPIFDDGERGRTGGPKSYTERIPFDGTLAPDADGTLVGTPGVGDAFVWLIQ